MFLCFMLIFFCLRYYVIFMLTSHFGYVTTLYHFAYVRFYLFMLILLVIMLFILQYIILLSHSRLDILLGMPVDHVTRFLIRY